MELRLTPKRIRIARALAVAADLLQIVIFPAFWEGALSLPNDVLDFVVGAAMIALLGWHWAFLPTFLSELIPVWDLVPTWTAAVFLVTRGAGSTTDIPLLPPPPLERTPRKADP